MNALKIRKRLNVPIPELPELAPMVGKDVDIVVTERFDSVTDGMKVPLSGHLLEQLRSKLPGDPFGLEFEEAIRQRRNDPTF